jgi:hypothetical protein
MVVSFFRFISTLFLFIFIFHLGFAISTDIIEYMQDYCDLFRAHIDNLRTHHKKWKSKLSQQAIISSYHTTKRAQNQTIRPAEKLARSIETLCDAIQTVINEYSKQVDKMYPSGKLRTTHKHYQTEVMKQRFKAAQSSLCKVTDKLKRLHEQEETARADLHKANILCQNYGLDSTTSPSKVTRANQTQKKADDVLVAIKVNIAEAEDEYETEKTTYRKKATELFEKCQGYEEERIKQIRATLISFIQTIHSSDYSAVHDIIYEELLSKIENEQSTSDDLQFWAQTYGVHTLTKSISSETTENEHVTSTIQEESQSTTVNVENEEEQQPTEVAITTTAKPKGKKNKNTATTQKKTSATPEPTTPDTPALNQV